MSDQLQLDIFPTPFDSPPTEERAKLLGCSCEWWGRGSIALFDPDCAILHLHWGVPWNIHQMRLFRV